MTRFALKIMLNHVIYIGYRIDEPRCESVTINAALYRKIAEQLGYHCDCVAYRGSLFSPLRLWRYLRQVAKTCRSRHPVIIHDFFVMSGFSLVVQIYLRIHRIRVRYVKTFINPPGGASLTTIEGLMRLGNNWFIYLLVACLAGHSTYISPLQLPRLIQLPAPMRMPPMPMRHHDGSVKVVYLGHALRKKGVKLLPAIAEMVVRARKTAVEFRFSFSDLCDVPQAVEALKRLPRCRVEQETDPIEFFGNADIYLLPISNGFAASGAFNTIWEAMSCGCAIVTTSVKHLPEVIDSHNAIIVANPTAKQFADAIIRLVDDPDELIRKRQNAIEAYAAYYQKVESRIPRILEQIYD